MARLAGVPPLELARVVRQAIAFVATVRPGSARAANQHDLLATRHLVERFETLHEPADAPLLLTASATGDRAVAIANTIGLLMQTYEATAALIGNTLVRLRRDADVGIEWPIIDACFLREVARYDSPVQNTRRYALRDCVLGGRQLRRGDAVLLVLAAANRDPAVNPEPDRFDPARPAARVYSWGLGAHQCPGVALSLTITRAGIEAVCDVAGPPAQLPRPSAYLPLANVRIPTFAD